MHGHAHSSRDTGRCARPDVPLRTFVKVRKLSRSLRYTGLSLAKLRDAYIPRIDEGLTAPFYTRWRYWQAVESSATLPHRGTSC